MSADETTEPLFTRVDAATLLAVEAANGGEWTGLGQVIVTFQVIFGRLPAQVEFRESCWLLCEADLVDYAEGGLSLTPKGRKLLRHAGSRGSAARPAKVTMLLQDIEEQQLADEGSVPEPSDEDVDEAFAALTDEITSDLRRTQASNQARLVGPPIVLPAQFAIGDSRFALRLPEGEQYGHVDEASDLHGHRLDFNEDESDEPWGEGHGAEPRTSPRVAPLDED